MLRIFPVFFAAAILVAIVGFSASATDTVVRCGHVTERTPASFVISSPGGDPLQVAIPSGMVSVFADYTCVSVLPGKPAKLVALLKPDMPGYVARN